MPRQKEPVALLRQKKAQGATATKALTKPVLAEREAKEVKVPCLSTKPPEWLSGDDKIAEFNRLSSMLLDVGIFSELDEELLANYIVITFQCRAATAEIGRARKQDSKLKATQRLCKLLDAQIKCGDRLGLNVMARCKLTVEKKPEKPANKFAKFEKPE